MSDENLTSEEMVEAANEAARGDRVAVLEKENEELSRRLADAMAHVEVQEAKIEELKPTRPVVKFLMNTPDDVRARFTPQQLKDLANSERIKENRERNARGDFPLPQLEGKELEDAIDRAIDMLLADREMAQPPLEGPLDRVLKMMDPDGNLRQIPYEPQINNMAGSLADGYERYRQKNFKMTDPLLCATKDCYREAAVAENGEYLFRAYCSQDHENRTERDTTQTTVPGITNRNVMKGLRPG